MTFLKKPVGWVQLGIWAILYTGVHEMIIEYAGVQYRWGLGAGICGQIFVSILVFGGIIEQSPIACLRSTLSMSRIQEASICFESGFTTDQ